MKAGHWCPLLTLTALLLCGVPARTASAAGPFGGSVTCVSSTEGRSLPRWVGTERGLFRLEGGRWNRVAALGQTPCAAVRETSAGVLLARRGTGLLLSADEGESWAQVTEGLIGRSGRPADQILTLAGDDAEPAQLYATAAGQGPLHSGDGGRTWRLLAEGLDGAPPPVFHAAALLPPSGERPLLMGTEGEGVWAYGPGGWRRWGEKLPPQARVHVLAAAPDDPDTVVAGTRGDGLWRSDDGGRGWRLLRKGLFGAVDAVGLGPAGRLLAHFPEEGLYAGTLESLSSTQQLKAARVALVRPRGAEGWLLGSEHDGLLLAGAEGVVVGDANQGLDATRVLAVCADGPERVWTGDGNGVAFSEDGGKTWSPRDQGLRGAPTQVLRRFGDQFLRGSGGQGVFRWSPETAAWEARSEGLGTANTIFALDADVARKHFYVGTEHGVYRADKDLALWEAVTAGLPHAGRWLVATSLEREGLVWCAGGDGVYRTADAGGSWERILTAGVTALAVQGTDDGEVLWVGEARALRRVGAGPDPEAVAVKVPLQSGEVLLSLLADGADLWVGSSRGLWFLPPQAEPRQVWVDAGVLSLSQVTPDGILFAGTDGRGVARFRLR